MGTHPIFESDFDCLTEQNVIFNLCSDSLSRGISGELFRAVDGDLDNQVSVRLVGLDFLKVQNSDMGLTLMPSELKYDFDRDYDGRVNASRIGSSQFSGRVWKQTSSTPEQFSWRFKSLAKM